MNDNKTFVIHSLQGCSYCDSARKLLRKLDLPYRSKYTDREDLRRIINAGQRANITYPQIFVGQRYIGGFDDLTRFLGVARQRGVTIKPSCSAHGCM